MEGECWRDETAQLPLLYMMNGDCQRRGQRKYSEDKGKGTYEREYREPNQFGVTFPISQLFSLPDPDSGA